MGVSEHQLICLFSSPRLRPSQLQYKTWFVLKHAQVPSAFPRESNKHVSLTEDLIKDSFNPLSMVSQVNKEITQCLNRMIMRTNPRSLRPGSHYKRPRSAVSHQNQMHDVLASSLSQRKHENLPARYCRPCVDLMMDVLACKNSGCWRQGKRQHSASSKVPLSAR